ncbi:MAG: hypothetical protein ACRCWO_14040 [Bosea sp. (in: a-proteobacteria)]
MTVQLSKPALAKLAAVACIWAGHKAAALVATAESDLNMSRAGTGAKLNTDGAAYAKFTASVAAILEEVVEPLLGDDEWPVEAAVEALDAALPSALVTDKALAGIEPGEDALAALVLRSLGLVDPRFLDHTGHHETFRETGFAVLSSVFSRSAAAKGGLKALAKELASADSDQMSAAGGQRETVAKLRERLAVARRQANEVWPLVEALVACASAMADAGHSSEATDLNREAIGLLDQLLAQTPGSLAVQRERFVALARFAQGLMAQGRIGEAVEPLLAGLATIRALVAAEPHESRHRRDLASALDIAGQVASQRDANQEALSLYRESLSLRTQLLEITPDDDALKMDVCSTHDRIGLALMADSQLRMAILEFNEAMMLRRELVEKDNHNPRLLRDVARSCDFLGEAMSRAEKYTDALSVLRSGRDIYMQLSEQVSDDLALRQDLASCMDRIGDVLMLMGEHDEAMRSYRSGLNIIVPLAASDSNHIGRQRNMALSHARVARASEMLGKRDEAIQGLQRGRSIILKLIRPQSSDKQLKFDLDWFDGHLRRLGRASAGGLGAL